LARAGQIRIQCAAGHQQYAAQSIVNPCARAAISADAAVANARP
jgi:hypothetical protein